MLYNSPLPQEMSSSSTFLINICRMNKTPQYPTNKSTFDIFK